uniref:Uncharacterized protein n=1 Tax=Myoviridae sp. ctwwN25 TaxID=2825209 RepID=A0A8S5PN11_9CAUD|nr:MAG TPA: hypothetical protein [Myoviridae sp. ctwwN25]
MIIVLFICKKSARIRIVKTIKAPAITARIP